MKKCSRCGSRETCVKKTRQGKSYPNWCRDKEGNVICMRCYCIQWRLNNPKYVLRYNRQYYYDNREGILEQKKEYHINHIEQIHKRNKQWYQDNKEYANLYRKIVQPRNTQLSRDRYRLKHGLWIP